MNQALIDQYVAGHLGEQEAEAFETYCLEHPEFARQVEAEQLLKAGVAQVARASPQEFAASRATSWRWQLALAASVVVAIGIVLYSWAPGAGTAPAVLMAAVDQPAGGRVLRLAMVRGADAMPVLPTGRARVEIVGLFEPGLDYTVTLTKLEEPPAARSIATLEHQRAASRTAMQVLIDGDRLTPGAYTLRVRRPEAADEPLEFVFVRP